MTFRDLGDSIYYSRTAGHDFQSGIKARILFVEKKGLFLDSSHASYCPPNLPAPYIDDFEVLPNLEAGVKDAYTKWESLVGTSFRWGIQMEVLEVTLSPTMSSPYGWKRAGSNFIRHWTGLRSSHRFPALGQSVARPCIAIDRASFHGNYLNGMLIPVSGYLFTHNGLHLSSSATELTGSIRLNLPHDDPRIRRIAKLSNSDVSRFEAMAEGLFTLDRDGAPLMTNIKRLSAGLEVQLPRIPEMPVTP